MSETCEERIHNHFSHILVPRLAFSDPEALYQDLSAGSDVNRGSCTAAACYPPSYAVTTPVTSTPTAVTVPFSALAGGSPVATLDRSAITAVNWQLTAPATGGCAASFTLGDVAFVP